MNQRRDGGEEEEDERGKKKKNLEFGFTVVFNFRKSFFFKYQI